MSQHLLYFYTYDTTLLPTLSPQYIFVLLKIWIIFHHCYIHWSMRINIIIVFTNDNSLPNKHSLTNFTSSVYFWITKEMNSKIVNDKKFCQESLTFLSHWSQMLYCFCWWYVKSPLQYKTLIQLQSKQFIKRLKCLILKRVVSYLLCFTKDSALSSI